MAALLESLPTSSVGPMRLKSEGAPTHGRAAGVRKGAVALGVGAAHVLGIVALLQTRVILVPPVVAVTVSFVETPKPESQPKSSKPPQLEPIKAHLVFEVPQLSILPEVPAPTEAALPSPAPATTAPAPAAQSGPMALTDELAVFCPTRAPPAYPLQSKHLHEQGEVTLRVELDAQGKVSDVAILKSSGFTRLDEAARAAVLRWNCNTAMRDGKPARAVAVQSLEFVLERR